ncbi:MAG: MmgE/PrpD family protein [Betaproteobacteria bacterium]|nr:MmgE/PrpD family protein [Betaproteobacteria bacterium]
MPLPPDYSLKLCTQIAAWNYEQLPASTVRTVKRIVLDGLGVIGGAARAAGIPELNQRLARWEAGGSATGLIGKRRYSPPSAALANGAAAHALDFDEIHDASRVHSACVVLPTLLATAEDAGPISGKDFIVAMAIGLELHARLGLACVNSLATGWHPTTLFGSLAASMAAGHLLELDPERLRNALGIAFHQASGSIQSAYDGVISKRLGPGFAARDAVVSAFLAADGLTGTREALEGKAGFFNLHARGDVNPALLTEGLGTDWRVDEFSFKPYSGCRCNHAAIGVGVKLHDDGIPLDEIEAIEIRMSEANWKLVGKPYDPRLNSEVHAQFNAAYSFARALTDGSVRLASYERPAIGESAVTALAGRIRVIADPGIEKSAMAPVKVDLWMRDGRTVTRRSNTIKGSREEPMTDAEMLDKLRGCFAFGLDASPQTADRLAEVVLNIEHSTDAVGAVLERFPGPPSDLA